MIVAVSTTKNEADIVGFTVAHLLDQGVDRVLVADASTDGTRDVLAGFHQVTVYDDTDPYHQQPKWVSRLAHDAYELGADWVLPVDADEFWCGISDLHSLDAGVGKVVVPMWHHYTWELREAKRKPMSKVAFRACPYPVVANGNHDVSVPGGSVEALEIRELQYRGVDHFIRKVRERNATIDPSLPGSEGGHHSRFADFTDEQLRDWWNADTPFWGASRDVVHDPIPSRFKVG